MLRGSPLVLLLAFSSVVACSDGREFTSGKAGGGAGGSAGSGGGRAGTGGKSSGSGGKSSGSGGTSKGGAGPAGSSGSASSGRAGTSGAPSGGTSSADGGTGANNAGSSADGGTGETGEGGEDTSGGASGAGTNGGSGGTSSAGTNSEAGSGGATAGSGTAGTSSGGGSSGTAGTSSGGSGGQSAPCDTQLLANADFDAGPTSTWRQESDLSGIAIIVHRNDADLVAEDVAPHSGNYLAWLGGIDEPDESHHRLILRQDVTIPADANSLTLSGRYWVKSVDEMDDIYDEAYLEFEDEEDVVWQARGLSNLSVTSGWTEFENSTSDLSRLAGLTVTFVAYSRTDPTGETSFFLDSLRLEAACGR